MTNPKKTDLQKYATPSVAVDLAIMTVVKGQLKAVLIERPKDDIAGWAMPGGFVHLHASLEETVTKVMVEKTNVSGVHFEQLATYGALDRDPRGRVISVVYLALCPAHVLGRARLADVVVDWPGETGGDAKAYLEGVPLPLAFDHSAILGDVVKRLRGKLNYSRVGYALLPGRFTLREAQEVHEAILGTPLKKPPFRRKLLDSGMIEATGAYETGNAYRPAELYQVKPEE